MSGQLGAVTKTGEGVETRLGRSAIGAEERVTKFEILGWDLSGSDLPTTVKGSLVSDPMERLGFR